MIAWNGVEKYNKIKTSLQVHKKKLFCRWKLGLDVTHDFDNIDVEKTSPLGINITREVAELDIKCKWVKLTELIRN